MSERDTRETDLSPIGLLRYASLNDANTSSERKLLMEFQQVFAKYENEQKKRCSLQRILAILKQNPDSCDEDVNRIRNEAKACVELEEQLHHKMMTIINSKEMTIFLKRQTDKKLAEFSAKFNQMWRI